MSVQQGLRHNFLQNTAHDNKILSELKQNDVHGALAGGTLTDQSKLYFNPLIIRATNQVANILSTWHKSLELSFLS